MPIKFVCHGCGAIVDAATALPFRCPAARPDDNIDHLLLPQDAAEKFPSGKEENPYIRYRELRSPYRLARSVGLSDDAWIEIVSKLDEALVQANGVGFRITPLNEQAQLAKAAGLSTKLWIKNETRNVAGSHKARHLMGVMLYLRVLQAAKLPAGEGVAERRLAIASCGNAALAAAVIARAANWPLSVFIPPDASANVVRRLKDLGADICVCERRAGEAGDPCFLRFLEAVNGGAIPFGVQGTENGLAIEGGRTIAFEMAEVLGQRQIDAIFVQIGGGALASGIAQGFAMANKLGVLGHLPRMVTVQTQSCAPLNRAWERLGNLSFEEAARQRKNFMWPWETAPHSIAHGILDDETYDWLEIAKGMRNSGGYPVIVGEDTLKRAHELGNRETSIVVSATGTSGFAGLLASTADFKEVCVIFSGFEQ